MKFLLTFFRKLFISGFEPSEEDFLAIENIKLPKDKGVVLIDNDKVSSDTEVDTFNNFLTHLIDIYEEIDIIEENSGGKTYSFKDIKYDNSNTHYNLINKASNIRVSFLHFLLDLVNNTPKNKVSHFHDRFISHIFNSVLETKLKLSEKDLDKFFFFRNENWIYDEVLHRKTLSYPVEHCMAFFDISTEILIKKIEAYSYKNPLSKKLLDFYKNSRTLSRYLFIERPLNRRTVYRVLTNTKYLENKLPFFLLEDYFGKKTNKILLRINEVKGILFSELLQLLSSETKETDKKERQINELIEKIETNFFVTTSIDMLKLVSGFKPLLEIEYTDRYFSRMFIENINITLQLLKILQRLILTQEVPINILETIILRSHHLKEDEYRLGRESIKLGNICIEILANDYGKKGTEKLVDINEKTTYKRLKNKISKELDK